MIVPAGLVRPLVAAGLDVCAEASDAVQLPRLVAREQSDVAIVAIRMPPTHRNVGLVVAREIR
jgi:DNA-binding NarL/FixJ family response regulator